MFDDAVDPSADVLRPLIADITTAGHDGKVVVVGTAPDGTLYYTVRQSGFEDNALTDTVEQTLPGFENWREVPLGLSTDDPSVRAHEAANLTDGSSRPIMRSRYDTDATRSAVGRPKLVSGLGHLYLFRVSADHKLLLNRFVLDGMTNELVPKLEVRFRRSEQRLAPDGGTSATTNAATQDSLGFRDLNQNTFFEPTQELSFVGTFSPGKPWFSVELLPTAEHGRHRWNIFAYIDDELKLISASVSAEGLVDPTDQAKVQQDPDKVDAKIVRTVPGIVERRLRLDGNVVAGFDSSLYHNQIERLTKAGPQLLKENTRVMLSVPISQADRPDPTIAAVSFAVNNLGQLAQIDRVADRDEMLKGDAKEVLLPLNDLEDIKLIADRNPPPEGAITKLAESQNEFVAISTDATVDGSLRSGQQVKVSGTRSYDGVYVAGPVADGTFEIDAVFTDEETDQGYWEVVETEDKGLVFENMIASYERTETGGLKITCLSHNVEEGDEIRISGSVDHDGLYPITNVGEDNSFELDRVWPQGEVVNLSRRPRRGLFFDGKGDYLEVAPVEFAGHFSDARLERQISAWVNLTEITDQPQTIFATKSDLLHLYVDRAGKATLAVNFADGHRARVTDPEPLPEGAWVHITAMLDYQGEAGGETVLTMCRAGHQRAQVTVEPRKPLHLPIRNLRMIREALPISTIQYDMAIPEAVTMEAWVSTGHNGRGVVASWYHNGQFELAINGDRDKRVVQWITAGHRMNGIIHLPNDDWHHIAVSYNPSTNEKTIFVNGALDSTKTAPAAVDDVGRELAAAARSVARDTKKPMWLGYLGAAAAETKAKGWDVNTIHHATAKTPAGSFRQVSTRYWRQLDAKGATTGDRLTEIDRDETSVNLRDDDDSYRMRFDLARNKVSRIDFNVESPAGEITSSVAVNGWNTNRVDFAGGSWQRTEGTTWRLFDADGTATDETRAETQRDAWSVYFGLPDGRHQFDLWRKKISDGRNVDTHDITGSAAPADESETSLNGSNVRRIDVADGYFETADGKTWIKHNRSGAAVGDPFAEITRGEWTVSIGAAAGDHRLQFNLWDKSITRTDNKVTTDIMDIVTAAAPSQDPAEGDRFNGFLADVRIWNRARSEASITRTWSERLTGSERNLIAHWPLEETGGPQLADATKSKAHVTVTSDANLAWFVEPHRAPGTRAQYEGKAYDEALTMAAKLDRRDRYALELDGETGHLDVPTMTEDLSAGYTVAAWARWDALHNWSRIVDFGNGPSANNIVLANRGETKALGLHTPNGWVEAEGVIPLGEWVHVAATVDETGRAVLYLNGEVKAGGNVGAPDSSKRSRNYIGRSNWDTDGYFKGGIRDVQFWNVALPAHEVKYYMNTPAKGIEAGLLHHWPMRTATIKGRKRVVDQGTGAARHAELRKGSTSERLSGDLPATPLTELRGKLSDVQLWTVNRPVDTVRETMHDQLTGNEYGLAGYWRCGGLLQDQTPGSARKVSPDFAADGHDARVVGDTYVSACELPRLNSVGKAVRYSNDDLVAVTQGARYRESFEFRATDDEGEFWTEAQLEDADGRGNRIFEISYWGRKSRTSTEKTAFKPDEPHRVIPVGDGWFRAECDVTIPNDVSMIRSFEIDDVDGLWGDEPEPPEGEWLTLSIRKHRLELISDSISRRTYTDELELPTLVDDASELADAIRKIPAKERQVAAKRIELDEILEQLLVFVNRRKFEQERTTLQASTRTLADRISSLNGQIAAYPGDDLNYRYILASRQTGKVLDYSGRTNAHLWDLHAGENQAWEFHATDVAGQYHVVCVKGRGRLTITRNGDSVYLSNGDGGHHRWTIVDLGREYRGLRNVATGGFLDVYAHSKGNGSLITTWGRTGATNQAWSFRGWFPGQAEARRLDARRADAVRRSNHVIRVPVYHHFLFFKKFAGYVDVNAPQRAAATLEAEAYRTTAQALRAKYPAGRQRKSTYDSELGALTRRRSEDDKQLKTDQARLRWLNAALADTTPEREAALLQERDRLEQDIRRLQDEINGLNTDYIDTAKRVQGEAQTLALVAEDPLGLKTYGAVLGFAAPISAVTSAAVAEGNVQLGYFDTDGRMRFTDYDATSDSVNGTYEQWVPSTVAVCPDLSRDDAKLELAADSPVTVNPVANTTEAWFYYPMPFQDDNSPYPVNVLTSDRDGQEAAIAVADNRRLGTVVDGFFHDAGIDLAADLAAGWHHVAARSEGGVTTFHLDGEPVGRDRNGELAIERHAMTFAGGATNGTNSHLSIEPTNHNFDNGFSVQTWVRWDSFSNWSTIMDWGTGTGANNIGFTTWGGHNALALWIYGGDSPTNLYSGDVLETGRWYNVAATVSGGIGILYIDGEEVARGEMPNPLTVYRTNCFIGLSNWMASSGYKPFHGAMSNLHVWNRALGSDQIRGFMYEPPVGGESGLLHHWPMKTIEVGTDAELRAEDTAGTNEVRHAWTGANTAGHGCSSEVMAKAISQPITTLGNRSDGGAPAGKLAEVRVWSDALTDEVIKVNSMISMTGNEPELEASYPLHDIIGAEAQARDHTGNHQPAALVAANPVARTAKIGNPGARVVELDGDDSRIHVAKADFTDSYTIEFLVKRTANDRSDRLWLTSEAHPRVTVARDVHPVLAGFDGDQLLFGEWSAPMTVSIGDRAVNEWVHVALVYDREAKTRTAYLDGRRAGVKTAVPRPEQPGDDAVLWPGQTLPMLTSANRQHRLVLSLIHI